MASGVVVPVAGLGLGDLRWIGLLPAAAGLYLLKTASGAFHRVETNIHTFRDPDVLVIEGLFGLSRNPMYLGFTLLLLGAALIADAVTALLPVAAFFLAAHLWYIPFEEKAAERRFGDAYRAYRSRVRRWL
jgi:protein-S-isoprenylcysteine O-methyltransferase Ste14